MNEKKSKVFDVDQYLSELAVTIKIGQKEFIVKDVPYEVRELFDSKDQEDHKAGLRTLLGCSEKDLEGYGFAATSGIISHIMENLFPQPSRDDQ